MRNRAFSSSPQKNSKSDFLISVRHLLSQKIIFLFLRRHRNSPHEDNDREIQGHIEQ